MYDKSKKTWSQRLKITKSEKTTTTATASVTTSTSQQHQHQQLLLHQQQQHFLAKAANNAAYNQHSAPTTPTTAAANMHLPTAAQTMQQLHDYHGGSSAGYDFSPSALSRSMKYAEPWIYGTVRGMPSGTRAYHYQQHGYMVQHPAAIFAHPTMASSELAIVICSCPEYLSGTKRDMKKASVCKKCKGSRLPLAPIGGTVRLRPSSTPLTLKARASGAATMRIVSSGKKSRPTILDPQQDPYDLMRRSRLLSPEPGAGASSKLQASPSNASKSSDKSATTRNRGKSVSPARGRSRTRPNLATQATGSSKSKQSDTKCNTSTASFSDCWLVEEPLAYASKPSNGSASSTTARRSILRCNVNPYDLISSKSSASSSATSSPLSSNSSTPTTLNPTLAATITMPNTPSPRSSHKIRSQNEFMAPPEDDFNVADAKLYDEVPPFLTSSGSRAKNKPPSATINHVASSKTAQQQQRSERQVKSGSNHDYEDVAPHDELVVADADEHVTVNSNKNYTNVKAIAGQRISLGASSRVTKKSLIKQSEDGRIYESIIIAGDEATDDDDDVDIAAESRQAAESMRVPAMELQQPKRPPRKDGRIKETREQANVAAAAACKQQLHVAAAPTTNVQLLSVTPTPAIKSILKRPACLLTDNDLLPTTSTATNSDNASNATRNNRKQQQRSNDKKQNGETFSTSTASSAATTPSPTAATATATFYIPLPQARKKVQFMVEDRLIQAAEPAIDNHQQYNSDSDNSNNNIADEDEVEFDEAHTATTTTTKSLNYEYYERKREQLKALQQLKQQQQELQQSITATVSATAANPHATPTGKCGNTAIDAGTYNNNNNNSSSSSNNKATLSCLLEEQQQLIDFNDVPTTTPTMAATTATTTTAANQQAATVTATLEHESNLVSSALSAAAIAVPNNNIDNNTACSSNQHDDNNVHQHVAAAMASNFEHSSNFAANATHYIDDEQPSAASMHASAHKDIQDTQPVTDPVVASNSNVLLPLFTLQSEHDDFDGVEHNEYEGESENAAKQPHKEQQQQKFKPQPLQAFVAAETALPLSRNPIRRSHSERYPVYNKLTNGSASNDASNKLALPQNSSNNAILNFKDTMALRMKNVRNDARDLFASNSTATAMTLLTSVRPREPPPPPPPTLMPTTANSTTAKVCTKESTTKTTSARRSSLSSLSLVDTTLSPAGHTQMQQQQQQQQPTAINADKHKDATATRNTKLSTNGLEKQHNDQQPQQQQQPATTRQVVVVVAGTADSVAPTTVTTDNENRSNSNNSASCQGINKRTGQADNSAEADVLATQCPTELNNGEQQKRQNTTSSSMPNSPRNINTNSGFFKTSTSQQERTVVRVAPFNKTSSEVHRLKINHTDVQPGNHNNDYNNDNDFFWHHSPSSPLGHTDMQLSPLSAQKKTSIQINGDDCYSTMNLSHDASTPLYQSSVVVADYSVSSNSLISNANGSQEVTFEGLRVSSTTNTVTINVNSSPRRSTEEELIYQHNQINSFLSRQVGVERGRSGAAIIPIKGSITEIGNLQRSASSTSSASATSNSSCTSSSSNSGGNTKRGRTLIKLDYDKERQPVSRVQQQQQSEHLANVEEHNQQCNTATVATTELPPHEELFSHEAELVKILRNPVEAVRRNLVPHVCGRNEPKQAESMRSKKMSTTNDQTAVTLREPPLSKSIALPTSGHNLLTLPKTAERNSFIAKLLEDPTLNQVAEGLENETIVQLIENSLKRLKESRGAIDTSGTKDNDDMMRLINMSLQKLKEERQSPSTSTATLTPPMPKEEDGHSNRGSISSATSFSSANNYEMFEFDTKSESDCYQSCSSEITSPGDDDIGPVSSEAATKRSKFYQMLVDATLAEIEISTGIEDEDVEHHYESIRNNGDPIYEEITDMPPPLPLTAPPLNDAELDKKAARSMFEGASKYDILSYLVDAKERGLVREEPAFEYPVNLSNPIIIEEEAVDTLSDLGKRKLKNDARDNSLSRASVMSDSSEDNQSTMSSLSPPPAHSFLGGGTGMLYRKGNAAEIERNDSGVGSETSKSSRSKYQHPLTATTTSMLLHKNSPIHLCEDCDGPVETQVTDSGVMFAPLVCRKCGKKRAERKEIITEIVETEEKYGRDLQIVLEEFCQPMLVAGLLTQEQLSAIFLNTEDLLENNQTLAERMRDALDIALEQGDDDLLTVNIGRIFLDFTQMLHAFESYCVRQAGASLLLANLEKEKELLRIFLKVSQMENTVLRRMNLNSFLMVPVQRVTKYPLLLARLYKVTPAHLEGRDLLKQAQEKIELHLNHINQEAKDVPTKLWRRISSSSPNRRASCEIDMINIKLRKMAIDVLEWNHDEVRFSMEGKLLYTQPTDSNWKKARTIKLTPVNALLVTNGKPSGNYKAEKVMSDKLNFPKHTGVREASLLVVKEKCGRYTLIREPLYLDRCVVCSEADWDAYFEVQEISSKDTFIFKAEDGVRTKQWYTQLQYHAQGMGAWRKRRNALANIMINGMLARS